MPKMFKPANTYVAIAAWAFVAAFIAMVWFILPVNAQTRPDSSQMSYTKQAGTILNSSDTSASDTAVVKTLTGVANRQIHLQSIDVVCSTGTSSVTVDDDTTEIFSLAVGTTQDRIVWEVPLTATLGNDLVVTLATCGSGNAGTLIIQADQY